MPARREVPNFDCAALVRYRQRAGLTQAELGKRIHAANDAVSRLERGTTPITAGDLRRVAEVLRVTPAQLQRPLVEPPTMKNLREMLALTCAEFAAKLRIPRQRLAWWETGALGAPGETGDLLAANLGVGPESIAIFERSGLLPRPIRTKLAMALRVRPEVVQEAFNASRRTHGRRSPATAA
jgi:transcriptional regulator with XRE-family HTH domain